MNQGSHWLEKPQVPGECDSDLVCDINGKDFLMIKAEPVIGDYHNRVKFFREAPEGGMLPYSRSNYDGKLQEDTDILWQETGVPYPQTRDLQCHDTGQLPGHQLNQWFISCEDHLAASSFQLPCQGNHPSGMAETPAERANEDFRSVHGSYPETLVAMPSLLTLRAIALSSLTGTFLRLLPSGVSRWIV